MSPGTFKPLHGPAINLSYLPLGLALQIYHSLMNERCNADMVLIIADAMARTVEIWGDTSIYRERMQEAITQLREIAPFYPGGAHA